MNKVDFNADVYLSKNKRFWKNLQLYCVIDCCGIHAFDFSKESIENASLFFNKKEIVTNIKELIRDLKSTELKYANSDIFNERMETKTFVEEFKIILKNF